ncbi:MAG: GtrA family protein [Nitrosomonas sp.]|nr:GtrA family protein [Nitrosomonas sp.]
MAAVIQMLDRETGRQLTGFSLIGVINTFIHLGLVTALVELLTIHPMPANGMAFIGANLFSFWANSRWSFRAVITGQRYLRFLAVSLIGLAVSVVSIAISETLHWHYLIGVLLSFIFLPSVTFMAHRYWTWKNLE